MVCEENEHNTSEDDRIREAARHIEIRVGDV